MQDINGSLERRHYQCVSTMGRPPLFFWLMFASGTVFGCVPTIPNETLLVTSTTTTTTTTTTCNWVCTSPWVLFRNVTGGYNCYLVRFSLSKWRDIRSVGIRPLLAGYGRTIGELWKRNRVWRISQRMWNSQDVLQQHRRQPRLYSWHCREHVCLQ